MLSRFPVWQRAAVRRAMSSAAPGSGKLFDKVLIANRGEIACRVIRTARKMGIKTVAVYSDADTKAQHVVQVCAGVVARYASQVAMSMPGRARAIGTGSSPVFALLEPAPCALRAACGDTMTGYPSSQLLPWARARDSALAGTHAPLPRCTHPPTPPQADEAWHIGPPPAAESYLRGERLLEVAGASGAQAVHPGYGFLSENVGFSRACADAGVTFIGPPVPAIDAMGSKSASKRIMIEAGVPVTPGYHGEDQSVERLQAEAEKIKYPVMIKAVLGGGGKGMRIVRSADEFLGALEACKREAMASFGDDNVLLERYLPTPRHIEFQIFGDTHGNYVHLFERDCSVQRRHQKVLEEAPAPNFSEDLRQRMGEAAVAAAKAVGYVGAGTVEFMLDPDTEEYFFMEMNTRLQVEHPVTESITGVDLVEWQLRVAAGQELPLRQDQLSIQGAALEARIYAENPMKDFLPATGQLAHLRSPDFLPDVRVDTGVVGGDAVSIYYDPMISKLITTGESRDAALTRMSEALDKYEVVGLPTNIAFLRKCVAHPEFAAGGVDTSFLSQHLDAVKPVPQPAPGRVVAQVALTRFLKAKAAAQEAAAYSEDHSSPWGAGDASRPTGAMKVACTFVDAGAADTDHELRVAITSASGVGAAGSSGDTMFGEADSHLYNVTVESGSQKETFQVRGSLDWDGSSLVTTVDGVRTTATVVQHGTEWHAFVAANSADEPAHYVLDEPAPEYAAAGAGSGAPTVVTPMPGKVIKVLKAEGDSVKAGEPVMILEAMKMEHVIKAPTDGVLARVPFAAGDQVEDGTVLAEFEPVEAE